MNATIKHFSPLLLLPLLLSSCAVEDSGDVNQSKIYCDYELFYNSNTDKTAVLARFVFGGPAGTFLRLSSPAYVLFEEDTLPYKNLYKGHYMEYAGRINGGSFTYVNMDGDSFENRVPFYDSIAFPTDLDTLSKSSAYTLTWLGTPLDEYQNVGLFIGNWTWGQDALFVEDGDGATHLVLGVTKLNRLTLGEYTCLLDRTTDRPISEGTEKGGRIRGKFRAVNRMIQVIE